MTERHRLYGQHPPDWTTLPWDRPDRFKIVKRVGLGLEENVRWLLRFAAGDLDKASIERLKEAWEEIVTFTLSRGRLPRGDETADPRQIHAALQKGLADLRAKRPFTLPLQVISGVRWGEEDTLVSVGTGDMRAIFFASVFEALREVGPRLRICENDKCRRLFVARRRQSYCSSGCSQLVRTERFRQAHPDEVKATRRARYQRRQREKYGPKVKIRTRSQKEN